MIQIRIKKGKEKSSERKDRALRGLAGGCVTAGWCGCRAACLAGLAPFWGVPVLGWP